MRVAILGAGPAGLSAAKRLSEQPGIETVVFEKSPRVGGLHRSVEIDGRHYDTGTFLFTSKHGLVRCFPELASELVPISYRPISLTPRGNLQPYPFSLTGYLKEQGLALSSLSLIDYFVSKFRYRHPQTLPEYAMYHMGANIYQRSGLKGYIGRLHGVPDDEIDIEFARKRLSMIANLSPWLVLARKINRKPGVVRAQRLVRPPQGMAYLYDLIKEELLKLGVELRFNQSVQKIESLGNRLQIVAGGEAEQFDELISTIPIPSALRLIGEEPKVRIETRSLVSLFFEGEFSHSSHVFFNFTDEARWKRITAFHKFYGGQGYFTVEIACENPSDSLIAGLRQEFVEHALKFRLLRDKPCFKGCEISANAYPVYRAGEMGAIEEEKARLKDRGIHLLGRQGDFQYLISGPIANQATRLVGKILDRTAP